MLEPEPRQNGKNFSYSKAARLLKRHQFLRLTNRSVRPDLSIKAGSFLLLASFNELPRNRLGVTVSKKIGSAVLRNRLKRLVREFFRLNTHKWSHNMDLVFIARTEAKAATAEEIEASFKKIDQKLTKCFYSKKNI